MKVDFECYACFNIRSFLDWMQGDHKFTKISTKVLFHNLKKTWVFYLRSDVFDIGSLYQESVYCLRLWDFQNKNNYMSYKECLMSNLWSKI